MAVTARTPVRLLAAAVVALEIPYPLVHGDARNALTVATVLVFAAASVTNAGSSARWWSGPVLLAVAGLGGFGAEAVGVHTGVPFGRYRYTGGLGPTLLDVPLVVPLAWVMMAHPSMTVARRLARRPGLQVVTAAVALASWDVFLDPQMVDAGHWRWSHPSPHLPGVDDVPLTNFGGWLLVALALMTLLRVTAAEPVRDDGPPITLWLWTWLSSALANVAFFHRPAVAAWGFVAMGLVGVPLVRDMVAR